MANLWDLIFGKAAPPGMPGGPRRQLSLPRLMNLMVNPFATRASLVGDFQSAVYEYNGNAILKNGYKDPFPIWIGVDLQLAALKVARGHFPIPLNFYLLSYFASSTSNVKGGFKAIMYDTTRRIPLMLRPGNFNTLAGTGSSPMFFLRPYPIEGQEPKIKWTIKNLETVAQNNIQLGLYGFQVSRR